MRTKRSLPFFTSCLMGLRVSSLEIWRGPHVSGLVRGEVEVEEGRRQLELEGNGEDLPPSCHWSSGGSRRSCSRPSAARWRTGEYRGRARRARHPSQYICGAPRYWGGRSFVSCKAKPWWRTRWDESWKRARSRSDELSVQSAVEAESFWRWRRPVWAWRGICARTTAGSGSG